MRPKEGPGEHPGGPKWPKGPPTWPKEEPGEHPGGAREAKKKHYFINTQEIVTHQNSKRPQMNPKWLQEAPG